MNAANDRSAPGMAYVRPEALLRTLGDESRIVFDLDGTIYDTRDFERPALAAVVAWLRERSSDALASATEALWVRRERDRHRPGLFDDLLASHGLPRTWGRECLDRFHAYPGVELESAASLKPSIAALRAGGRRIALVTNGEPGLQRRKLDRLGLTEAFDACIFCDPKLQERLKPSAWAWTQLSEWRDGHPGVYVGDDPVDAAFADSGGARFVPFKFRSSSHAD